MLKKSCLQCRYFNNDGDNFIGFAYHTGMGTTSGNADQLQ